MSVSVSEREGREKKIETNPGINSMQDKSVSGVYCRDMFEYCETIGNLMEHASIYAEVH